MLLKLISTLIEIRHLICGNNYSWILNLNLTYKTLQTGAGSGLLISMLEKVNLFHWTNLKTLLPLLWKCISLLLKKNHLSRCFPFYTDWGSYTVYIAKTASEKFKAIIHSREIISSKVTLYLYKSTNVVVMPGMLLLAECKTCINLKIVPYRSRISNKAKNDSFLDTVLWNIGLSDLENCCLYKFSWKLSWMVFLTREWGQYSF